MSDPQGRARHWHFDWRLMLFSGVFLPLLIGLGLWQLDRAGQKQELLTQWQQQALDLRWPELVGRGLDSGRPVTLRGRFGDHSWLLDNRTRDGMPGYEVLTLFFPLQGPPVVVNRGWIQAPRHRDELPRVPSPEDVLEVSGRISEYPEPPVLNDQTPPETSWPRRVQSLPRAVVADEITDIPEAIIRLAGSDQRCFPRRLGA
ncbi:SURF1 family protein [Marinobacter similis]|uniref:SURF1 family protein n=1 Tax=Marinobacter similis TaxID=1420916 RepID=UPI000A3F4C1D|nr:SURF1 family protein [Marinobacter similis]